MEYLSSEHIRADPRNHCNPLLDAFHHPSISDGVFLVSPWLHLFYLYPLESVNEVVDMMLQTFEVRVCLALAARFNHLTNRVSHLCIKTASRIGMFSLSA